MKYFIPLLFLLLFSLSSFGAIGSIAGDSSICVGMNVTFTDSTAFGSWTSGDTLIGTIDSAGNFSAISVGTTIITYTTTTAFVVKTITVNPIPDFIVGATVLCDGASATLYDNTPGGGSWSCINYFEFNIDYFSDSTVTITGAQTGFDWLIFTSFAGCMKEVSIFVAPSAPAISGDSIVFVDSTITLTDGGLAGVWSSSDTTIAKVGAYTGILTGISPGAVTITYYEGCTTSTTITVLPLTGVPVVTAADNKISIYPNPGQDNITITASNYLTDIVISNLMGQALYMHRDNAESVQINVSIFPPGIYFIKINNTEVRKFVKY